MAKKSQQITLETARRELNKSNLQHPRFLRPVIDAKWPNLPAQDGFKRIAVWRSSWAMVQVFEYPDGTLRLTCNRMALATMLGDWVDNLTWDQLQQLKQEAGYGEWWGIEVYPPQWANITPLSVRHLFLSRAVPSPHVWMPSP